MKTKYTFFSIGQSLFYNNGKICIHVSDNKNFPLIEYLEYHAIEYYNKTWRNQMIEISKEIFKNKFDEISNAMKQGIDF